MNDAARRFDKDQTVNIQLLKQPGETAENPVALPADHPTITLSKFGEDENIIFNNINIIDAAHNKVTVDENGHLIFTVPVSDVTLNETSFDLYVGNNEKLTATVFPDNATDKTVTWKSSDTTVATVDDGLVTAVAPGTADITATAGGKTATCHVTVTTYEPPVEPSTPSYPDDNDDGYSVSVPASSSIRGGSITVCPRRAF